MKDKKIAILANSLGCGGTERVISRIVPLLRKYYEVYLILLNSSETGFEVQADHMICLGGNEPKNRLKYALQLFDKLFRFKKIVNDNSIRCVISFLSIPNIINILFNRKKSVISIRGQLEASLQGGMGSKIKYYLEKKLYSGAKRIIVPSEYLENHIRDLCNVKGNILETIYNPFDIDEITKLSEEDIVEYKQIFEDYKVYTALGRLTFEKGYINLIEAFSLAYKERKDIRLLIIGEGKEREKIERKIDELGLSEAVIMAGRIDNPFPYLKRSFAYVMSSVSEGFPNSLVEAMACAVPVISSDCKSGPREILFDKTDPLAESEDIVCADYGILVPPFDYISEERNKYRSSLFSKAILMMYDNDELRERYKDLSCKRASRFSVESCIEAYRNTIDSVIG